MADKMSRIPGLKLLIFTGALTGSPAATDVLIVGKVDGAKFDKYLNKIAEGLPTELRCTNMTVSDYVYRLDITDKFIYDIWSNKKIIVVDKISKDLKNNIFDDFDFKHFRTQ
jgi:hypothetical protein